MMQTYYDEIRKKRRASRIFWGLVFFFAFFLYFFFQGYYPAIDFSFREVFTTGGVRRPEMGELVKSFGIINISVTPKDASLSLQNGAYSNDEKRMTSYGTYSLLMTRNDYVPGRIEFAIDRETPYYIDTLSLLPIPRYTRVGTGIDHIANISDSTWTAHTESGMILLDTTLSGGVLISSGVLTHIGEGSFLSGNMIMNYDSEKELWERKSWSGSTDFIAKCGESPRVAFGRLFCKKQGTVLTEKGKTYTGVTDIQENLIKIGNTLLVGDTLTPLSLTGNERGGSLFLERSKTWYVEEDGEFHILRNQKTRTPPLTIITGLEKVKKFIWYQGAILAFGKKGEDTFLSFIDPLGELPARIIPFPDISLEGLRIYEYAGNIFIKTEGALLHLYHNSDRLTWIIDGEILAVSDTAALYRKDGIIWRAHWSEEK